MKRAFITGTSDGLGQGLAQHLSETGWEVFGCSRRGCTLPGVHDVKVDLSDYPLAAPALEGLLSSTDHLDLVILNAGILGRINNICQAPLEEVKEVMEVNLWANKGVLDLLCRLGKSVDQIVMISSGAAILGNKGWGGYALSKAALNMLAKLYAHELKDTHISALAPGIIDTAMMNHLCEEADADAFPALERLRAARGTDAMPDPLTAAVRLISILPQLRQRPSGEFVDIREILDPEGYASLYGR
jgi:NAD(P)-dependent dehydrogenase (short-subunit alcohol dehydrogenase family)